MARLMPLLMFAAFVSVPASAQGPVSIAPGESLLLQVSDRGSATVEARGAAPALTPFDTRAVRDMVGSPTPPSGTIAPARGINDEGAKAVPPAPGRLRVTFRTLPGKSAKDSVLAVENGYELAVRYRVVIHVGPRSGATDVCIVPPGKRGYEHWPYAIDRLDVGGFQFVAWKEGDPITCD